MLAPPANRRLLHIDSLRGYAILMVIACHTSRLFQDLPWRFSQLFSSGWHGVQLFFLASTFTLLMSSEREASKGHINWKSFFIRRFFRIAPAYYVAAIIYVFLYPERMQSLLGTLVFATFLNSWIPFDIGQQLVLGGWSISVEFSFYFIFPFIFLFIRSIKRAVCFFTGSIVLAICTNVTFASILSDRLLDVEISNFNYFSFWNQLPVFAYANLVYHLAYRPTVERNRQSDNIGLQFRGSPKALSLTLIALATAAYIPLPRSFTLQQPWLPGFFFSTICFSAFCVIVASEWPRLFINPFMKAIGEVSFSAYLWHWLIMDTFSEISFGRWLFAQKNICGMVAYFFALAIVVGVTWLIASVSYRFVEIPGMAIGRKLSE